MEDIAEQLAIRDRFRRRKEAERSPAERMQAMYQLQRLYWERLKRSPDGLAHFMRRNFKKRAIDVTEDPHAS